MVKGTGQSVTFAIFKRLSIRLVSKHDTPVCLWFLSHSLMIHACRWLILNYCHIWNPVSISGLPVQDSQCYTGESPAMPVYEHLMESWPGEWETGKWVRIEFPLTHIWKFFCMGRVVRQQNSLPERLQTFHPLKYSILCCIPVRPAVGEPSERHEIGLDNLQRPLPTSLILKFSFCRQSFSLHIQTLSLC